MNALDVSRWQFGITTVYHFIFVPLTIGLAPLWSPSCRRCGCSPATPLVSPDQVLRQAVPDQLRPRRGHRHRAGIPVRHELERVLPLRRRRLRRPAGHGGPGRLLLRIHLHRAVDLRLEPAAPTGPPGLHLDRGDRRSTCSAFFIIAANSFMQHPVGAHYNPQTGRAELDSIVALLTNNTAHRGVFARGRRCVADRGTFVAAVCAWWMVRAQTHAHGRPRPCTARPPSWAALVALAAAVGLFFTGDLQGKLMFAAAADEDGVGGVVVPHRNRSGLLHPDRRHPQQLRQRHPRHRGALRAAVPGRRQVQRRDAAGRAAICRQDYEAASSAPATTGPTCSSPTGPSA